MAANLIFVTGGSSGVGAAMAQEVPYADTRVIDISRRGLAGVEHFAADLADPEQWNGVSELFAAEMNGFDGERVVLIHSAGTLHPIGFAGEVSAKDYARQVLLNSASPQVLGEAFLRAARETRAACFLVMISSGAARNIYEGWSAYGPGKAAVDQWVRTVGAEQQRRGGRCKVLSIAPGIVATGMQAEIRATPSEDFPEVESFVELHETGQLREPGEVATEIWALIEKDLENGAVVDLRDPGDSD
jgi:NAD(P)-dependent dehydrogenase (short-subunit alcohol dehydrogenase family)